MKVQLNNYLAPIEAVVKNTVSTTNQYSLVHSVIATAAILELSPEALQILKNDIL